MNRFVARRGLVASISLSALLAVPSAHAEPSLLEQVNADIELCREGSTTAADRIACLESAMLRRATETLAASEEQEPPSDTSAQLADAAPQKTADEPTGLGKEQVLARTQPLSERKKDREESSVSSALTDFAVNRNGFYVFFLENGQIWRQKSSDSNRAKLSPRRSYSAEVSEGMVSGYRLKLDKVKRPFLVERLK